MEYYVMLMMTSMSRIHQVSSSSCGLLPDPPTNLNLSIRNFNFVLSWTRPNNSSDDVTYSLYSKFSKTSSQWRRIEKCQELSTTFCSFVLSDVVKDRVISVVTNENGCSSNKLEATILVSPSKEVRLLPPDFDVEIVNPLIFIHPHVDWNRESRLFSHFDVKYQIEVGEYPKKKRSNVTLKTADIRSTEIDAETCKPRHDDATQHKCCVRIRFYEAALIKYGLKIGDGIWSERLCFNNTEARQIATKTIVGSNELAVAAIIIGLLIVVAIGCYSSFKGWRFYKEAYKNAPALPSSLVQVIKETDATFRFYEDNEEDEADRSPCAISGGNILVRNSTDENDTAPSQNMEVESLPSAITVCSCSNVSSQPSELTTLSGTSYSDCHPECSWMSSKRGLESQQRHRLSSTSTIFNCSYRPLSSCHAYDSHVDRVVHCCHHTLIAADNLLTSNEYRVEGSPNAFRKQCIDFLSPCEFNEGTSNETSDTETASSSDSTGILLQQEWNNTSTFGDVGDYVTEIAGAQILS